MFAKLLKHEWRSSKGLLGVLTLCVLGVGVLGSMLLAGLKDFDYDALDANPLLSLLVMGMVMALGLCILALSVYMVAVGIILLYRFYKNKFTDEGYLTFTLPVTTEQIYWASALNMLIWFVISTVAVAGAVILAVAIGVGDFSALEQIWQIYVDLFEIIELEPLSVFLAVLTGLASVAYGLTVPLACIAGGAVLAKKHKILAAFGVYYVINMILSLVSGVVSFLPAALTAAAQTAEAITVSMNLSAGLNFLVIGGLAAASYFVTIHLMKHKLNLP